MLNKIKSVKLTVFVLKDKSLHSAPFQKGTLSVAENGHTTSSSDLYFNFPTLFCFMSTNHLDTKQGALQINDSIKKREFCQNFHFLALLFGHDYVSKMF